MIANRLTFVGTMHHELSHAIVLFLTGAKILKINFFYPQGAILGKVTFQPRGNKILQSIQLTLGSVAPVITGITSFYILIYKALSFCTEAWQTGVIYYLIISILMHTTMSKQDIKNALRGLPICSLIIFLIFFAINFNLLGLITG